MVFCMSELMNSVSEALKEGFPQDAVYIGPEPQDAAVPCLCISVTSVKSEEQTGGVRLRNIGLDIVYKLPPDTAEGYGLTIKAAETLEERLEVIAYGSGADRLRTSEHEWKITEGALHYQLHVKAAVSRPVDTPAMESIGKYKGGVRHG